MATWVLHYLLVAFLITITYSIDAASAGITRHYTFHVIINYSQFEYIYILVKIFVF